MSAAIIIPAYNAGTWIAEAIESALAQTQPAASVVVVDDGSTDNTAMVAEQFDDAVMLLRQRNAGVSAARNHGAAQATAEWLLFLDADDRLRPDALATLSARAAQSGAAAAYGQCADFDENGTAGVPRGDGSMQGSPPAAAKAAFWKAPISTPGAALIRRAEFEQAGAWDVRFNTTADRDLWCRLGVLAGFAFVPKTVVERRVHGSNMSADKNRARRQAVEVQLAFLEWCAGRGITADFLETSETAIFERNAVRAVEERAFAAAEWIAGGAEARGISTAALARARRLAAMPAFARELELKVRGFFS